MAVRFRRLLPLVMAVSCAPLPPKREPYVPPALPTGAEVATHVAAHWLDEWNPIFAQHAGRVGEAATLVKVDKVACGYHFVVAQCEFEVTGRFATGDEATRSLSGQFDRDVDGRLKSVILSVHRRTRR
jgi:hypothetical protein